MNNVKIRIAIVLPCFSYGGGERMVALLASSLNLDKFEVMVICNYGEPQNNIMEKMITDHGARIAYVRKGLGFSVAAEKRLWAILSSFKPDIVHTHLNTCMFCASWCIAHGVPMLHTIHNIPEKEAQSKFRQMLMKYMFSRRKAIPIAISLKNRDLTACFYNIPIDSVEMIENPVDCGAFARNLSPVSKRNFDCINVARLDHQKNQARLIRAVAKMREGGYAPSVAIVGDGPVRDQLKSLVADLGLQDRVLFFGVRDDIADLLAQSGIFVLSSDYEGFPMSILEAMAVGIPVLSTNVGGVSDVVKDGVNGRLVDCDIDQIAAAISELLGDEEALERMSLEAKRTALAFDAKEITRRYEKLYEKYAK